MEFLWEQNSLIALIRVAEGEAGAGDERVAHAAVRQLVLHSESEWDHHLWMGWTDAESLIDRL